MTTVNRCSDDWKEKDKLYSEDRSKEILTNVGRSLLMSAICMVAFVAISQIPPMGFLNLRFPVLGSVEMEGSILIKSLLWLLDLVILLVALSTLWRPKGVNITNHDAVRLIIDEFKKISFRDILEVGQGPYQTEQTQRSQRVNEFQEVYGSIHEKSYCLESSSPKWSTAVRYGFLSQDSANKIDQTLSNIQTWYRELADYKKQRRDYESKIENWKKENGHLINLDKEYFLNTQPEEKLEEYKSMKKEYDNLEKNFLSGRLQEEKELMINLSTSTENMNLDEKLAHAERRATLEEALFAQVWNEDKGQNWQEFYNSHFVTGIASPREVEGKKLKLIEHEKTEN